MDKLSFRQVHLDFHTSEEIKNIGANFSKKQFQSMLQTGRVESITLFAKCHHGWAYFFSDANEMHPNLTFDLLSAQIEAAHDIGVKTPIYVSAGLDEKMARRHPEWLIRDINENTRWTEDFKTPGYHEFCFNTPYLDYLLSQIEEVLAKFDTDGLFLDIVGIRECYCQSCVDKARKITNNPLEDIKSMKAIWEETYKNYTDKVQQLINKYRPNTPVFHNSGHIRRGRRDLIETNSHLELESLPTGGWGYQHFPLSARYAQGLNKEYLGMTGKFHNMWGEFGGYKHPNALRYETALCLANGAKCSIGDQLHPEGIMDAATYELIGAAYKEVAAKQAWCNDVASVADIALLSTESINDNNTDDEKVSVSDQGCVKMLLEGNYLFDVIDYDCDFTKYKVVILPDFIRMDDNHKAVINKYIKQGGKVLASGVSGLSADADSFVLDFGIEYLGESQYCPSYFKPLFKPKSLEIASYVMYSKGHKVKVTTGTELGEFQNPYFNREVFSFCSHQHTPSNLKRFSPGMVAGDAGIYIPWEVFSEYDQYGSLILKEMVFYALDRLLGNEKTIEIDLPSQGTVTLMTQEDEKRYILHLLYASPIRRGEFDGKAIDVIEDIVPIFDTEITLRVTNKITNVYLAPEKEQIEFRQNGQSVSIKINKFECHQMVVLDY